MRIVNSTAVAAIKAELSGTDVAMVNLGDVSVYATARYIFRAHPL